MPEIQFPAIDGVTGTTCGVYAFSYFSGCTDDQGITRGFTQEWYFDGDIGAWVSVTQGVTGGGADLSDVADPYTSFEHEAPSMTGTGDIRKVAFLDPTTGGLTYDFIGTYDVVNPEERQYSVNNFRWLSYDEYIDTPTRANQLSMNIGTDSRQITSGTTLCAPASYEYVIGTTSDNTVGFRFYINRLQSGSDYDTTVSPLSPAPGNSADQFLLTSAPNVANFTVSQPSGVPADRILPFEGGTYAYVDYFDGVSGEVTFASGGLGSPVIGFTTAAGPREKGFEPRLTFSNDPDPTVGANDTASSQGVRHTRHENYIYIASLLESQVGSGWENAKAYIDANNTALTTQRATTSDGETNLLGLKLLLDPRTKGSSNTTVNNPLELSGMQAYQRIQYNLSSSNFVRAEGERYFPLIAIPTRAIPALSVSDLSDTEGRRGLFASALRQDGDVPQANGFDASIFTTLDITNAFGYQEEYTVFIAEEGSGIGAGTIPFKINLDRFSV